MPNSAQRAFSLVEVMIAVVVVGAVAAGVANLGSHVAKYIRYDRLMSDRMAARDALVAQLDCTTTFAALGACATGTSVNLLDLNGNNLVPGGIRNRWRINATCDAALGLKINGVWQSGTTHPMTGAPIANTTLFPSGITFCRDSVLGRKAFLQTQGSMTSSASPQCGGSTRLYKGTANCPAGYTAISGGAACGWQGASIGNQLTGPALTNWESWCCSTGTEGPPTVYAICGLVD